MITLEMVSEFIAINSCNSKNAFKSLQFTEWPTDREKHIIDRIQTIKQN